MTIKTPTWAADAARSLINDARIIDRALTGYVTVEGLTQAQAAIQRIRSESAVTASIIRRLRSEALASRAEDSRRRERGMPTPPTYTSADLAIPARPA